MIRFDFPTIRNATTAITLAAWAAAAGAHTGTDGGAHHGVFGELTHGEPLLALSALLGVVAVAAAAWIVLRNRSQRRDSSRARSKR